MNSITGRTILASDGFIREVDEELQRDRVAQLWKSYGPLAVGLALVVVVATAGKVGWDAWQARQLAEQGAAFAAAEAALSDDDPAAAIAHFASIADGASDNVASVAKLRQAEAMAAAGDSNGALVLLDELTNNSQIDPVLRDFATIALAIRQLNVGDASSAKATLEAHDAEAGTFSYSARELGALVALQDGATASAVAALKELRAEAGTPEGIRRRADELLAALGVEDESAAPAPTETEEAS